MADILYTYKNSVYANITNKCNCRCTFCIRFQKDGIGSSDTLWHQQNPTKEEVLDAIRNFDFTGFDELVFCGYGEPTCALDILLAAAKTAREEKGLKTRLNTNGLGNEENGRNIIPELSEVIDSVSISLNAPDSAKYQEVTRPQFNDGFEKMIDFATKCRDEIKDVKWSIVDVLPEEDIEKCKELSEKTGVQLRIRHFSKNSQ
ncbi:TIGR04100 family radical SAM protein [Butyrivibrio sp. INlla16]|uniref:TIGR04100 family radical SAM protein n=1 Tax=Butyrivibrio sp. INlla16 TaxID=1520807 RepID=UPI00088BA704|nr:TIGR04100 family radical SAM protein [Butyrivibrio sp. INlla16]SDB28160.1 radical SAM enzyme, TIGR04100 family [Butyrivibrio sp. INlla16]